MSLNITITDNVLTFVDYEGVGMEFDLVPTALGHKTFETKQDATMFEWCALDTMRQVQEDFTREELRHMMTKFNVTF